MSELEKFMKYVIFLGDGMADLPFAPLNNKTPLDLAHKPNMDRMAVQGSLYSVQTVPDGMPPGSDTANMSAMGIDPARYYSGRSPLEAVSMGIDMKDNDLAFRANVVTLSDEPRLEDCVMLDYSSGEITSEESAQLVATLKKQLDNREYQLFAGKSYRHLLIWHGGPRGNDLTPPHDITNRPVRDFLPKGPGADVFLELMNKSRELLVNHEVNRTRRGRGLNTADCLWPWGEGTRPSLPPLKEKYGLNGAVISAVDLVQGIGISSGMEVIHVEGATGTLSSNFKGKGEAAIQALMNDVDYVYIHVEAPDECGHQGDARGKIQAIEQIDQHIVGPVWQALERLREKTGEPYRMLLLPDHPTPLATRTHSSAPVPAVLFDSERRLEQPADVRYDEASCERAANGRHPAGHLLFAHFIDDAVDPFAK
jgi:2,3-bisphosphoglycerate-independent phosphoglycerate mutase